MNPFTHAKIAKEIHYYIKQNYPEIDIPLKTFVWGNIKPDFKKDKKLHYIDKNLEEALKMYDELNSYEYSNSKDYTVRLGEFFHYIADFFCYAHSTEFFQENLGEHFIYEMRAHQKLKKFKDFFNQNLIEKKRIIDGSENLLDYLIFNHKKYLKSWNKAENDYIYTLKLTPVLVNNIIINNKLAAEVV